MLFGETVAVYCENHTEHINTLRGHFSLYLTGSTLRIRFKSQPVNAVWGSSRCLLCTKHINTLIGRMQSYFSVKVGGTYSYHYIVKYVFVWAFPYVLITSSAVNS
jgi:hypothetical protein